MFRLALKTDSLGRSGVPEIFFLIPSRRRALPSALFLTTSLLTLSPSRFSFARTRRGNGRPCPCTDRALSLIHISEPTRLGMISYAVFCLKKKKKQKLNIYR